MLLVSPALVFPQTVRRRMSSVQSPPLLAVLFLVQLGSSATACAATEKPAAAMGGFWSGIAIGLVLVGAVVVIFRQRIKVAQREAARAKELAAHREYERNVAQQELLRRLEEERELAKEKLQSIAEKFNKKDHTTVIAAVERVRVLKESDPAVAAAVLALTAKLAP